MERKDWILVVLIVLVVAALSSFVTVKITGNVVRAYTTTNTAYPEVYTKAEIDSKWLSCGCNDGGSGSGGGGGGNNQTNSTKINGVCGLITNTCTSGVFVDSNDTSSTFNWLCIGINGGNSVSCSSPKGNSTGGGGGGGNNQTNQTGSLSVFSVPSKANLYIDGAFRGFTPITVSGLIVGNHNVLVTKSGYSSYSATKYIYVGGNALNVTLTKFTNTTNSTLAS